MTFLSISPISPIDLFFTRISAVLPSRNIGWEDVFVLHSMLNPVFSADWIIDFISVKFASLWVETHARFRVSSIGPPFENIVPMDVFWQVF